VILASDVIRPDDVKKKVPVFNMGPILIPTTNILNEYIDNGVSEVYERSYYEQLNKPNRLFLINEMLYRMYKTDGDVFVVISADEVEYKYLKMFNGFLRLTYHCKMTSAKKYLKGETFDCDEDYMIKKLQGLRTSLGQKLIDSGYLIYDLLGIIVTPSSLKEFPKDTQKRIVQLLKGR
jgi:hypothetical protein